MIRVVLFDFNGVVINDEPLQMKAYQRALQERGITLTEADYYASLGMDDKTFMRSTYERAGQPLADELMRDVIERKATLHREVLEADELPLFPGVVTFAKSLARDRPLAIVSMARLREIEYVLQRADLTDAFSVVVSADDTSRCKPDPECFNTAFQRLDEIERGRGAQSLSPAECLVIEDSPPGVRAARQAGMRTLGVTNTVPAAELRAAGAEIVTGNLADWTPDTVHHLYEKG